MWLDAPLGGRKSAIPCKRGLWAPNSLQIGLYKIPQDCCLPTKKQKLAKTNFAPKTWKDGKVVFLPTIQLRSLV